MKVLTPHNTLETHKKYPVRTAIQLQYLGTASLTFYQLKLSSLVSGIIHADV